MNYSNRCRYDDILLGLLYARVSRTEQLTLQDTKIARFSTLENTSEVQKVISSGNDSN